MKQIAEMSPRLKARIAGLMYFRSSFLPRIIGVLLAIEGLCYLINSFANFLAPEFAARFLSYQMASAVGQISLCLWLLVIGVNVPRWEKTASAAEETLMKAAV